MTNNQLTREWLQGRIANMECYGVVGDEALILQVYIIALAVMDSEPVFTLEVARADYKEQKLGNHFGFITLDTARKLEEGKYQLYLHAQPEPVTPDGYVMVPKIPTAEMISSGISAHYDCSQIQIHDRPAPGPMECAYVAMLAAAPQEVGDV